MGSIPDCAAIAIRKDFATYVEALINATGGDLSLLSNCRQEVCVALWDNGNPDVSGIGVRFPPTTYIYRAIETKS